MASRRRYLLDLAGRLWKFVAVFVGVYLFASVAFYFLQGNVSFPTSLYWAIITLATIGYGDVIPTTALARDFTIGVAFTQIFLLGYLITVISSVTVEESQKRLLGALGTDLRRHVVVLGQSAIADAAIRELLIQGNKVAAVVDDPAQVANVRARAPESQLYVTYGGITDPEILRRTNLEAASAVIVCSPDDTRNLIASLHVRRLVPNLRIVVSVGAPELKETLKAAGVTYVAAPDDMGGRLCADAAFRPEVASAVEDLTTATYGADIMEYVVRETTPISRQALPEAERLVRDNTGCLVIGVARPGATGEYQTTMNPPASFQFRPGDALLLLGSLENAKRFRLWYGTDQGR